ncbi:histidine--tRNA ligase [Candidatus Sumerlaeota bacterium]|nr:histidine--tRNA ligase [Candidatus Sumerlaeota bacterium]
MGEKIIEPRAVSGFPEWLPEEEIEFQRLLEIIRQGFERFGFTPIETPAAELLDVLASKGEINKQIYGLSRPNAAEEEKETDLALRFDLTVPLARYVAMNFGKLAFPFRRYQIQKVWRGERPQKGRFREFYQCDIDVVGNETLDPLNDAEIPAIIYEIFMKMQIGEFTIRMSNRKILQGYLAHNGISGEGVSEILRSIDRLPKTGMEAVRRDLSENLGLEEEIVGRLLELAGISGRGKSVVAQLSDNAVDHPRFAEGLHELNLLVDHLGALGVPESAYEIDLSITRGLDYYTGTVYETFLKSHPDLGSVCSGGRYDNLASHFTKQNLPGVGISIGLTRLFSYLLEAGAVKPGSSSKTQVLVAVLDRARLGEYFKVATLLRNGGVSTEVFLEDKKLKAQFKYADKKGIPCVLIAGEDEFAKGVWLIKNMKTGEQREIKQEEIVERISGGLS